MPESTLDEQKKSIVDNLTKAIKIRNEIIALHLKLQEVEAEISRQQSQLALSVLNTNEGNA
jgi:hypothetical protein